MADRWVVAAALHTVFAQSSREAAAQQLHVVAQTMAPRWPKATEFLREEEVVMACTAFPEAHWARLYSTSPLERLNEEFRRRTNVALYSTRDLSAVAAAARLVGAVLMDALPATR